MKRNAARSKAQLSERRGLRTLLKPWVLLCHRTGPGHFLPRRLRALGDRSLTYHLSVQSVYTGGKGEEEGWRRSASLPTAAHTQGRGEPARTLRMGLARVFRALRDPRVRFPHICAQSCRAFTKIKEREPNAGRKLTHAAAQPLGQVWADY